MVVGSGGSGGSWLVVVVGGCGGGCDGGGMRLTKHIVDNKMRAKKRHKHLAEQIITSYPAWLDCNSMYLYTL